MDLSKGTYGSETVALAERLSIEHELRNGNMSLTTPELSELHEDGFLAKASRTRKRTYTQAEISEIMNEQPGPTEPEKTETPAPKTRRDTFRTLPGSATCTNCNFRD